MWSAIKPTAPLTGAVEGQNLTTILEFAKTERGRAAIRDLYPAGLAILDRNVEGLQKLIAEDHLYSSPLCGFLLRLAIRDSNPDIIRILLEKDQGEQIDQCYIRDGLKRAARAGSRDIVKWLVQYRGKALPYDIRIEALITVPADLRESMMFLTKLPEDPSWPLQGGSPHTVFMVALELAAQSPARGLPNRAILERVIQEMDQFEQPRMALQRWGRKAAHRYHWEIILDIFLRSGVVMNSKLKFAFTRGASEIGERSRNLFRQLLAQGERMSDQDRGNAIESAVLTGKRWIVSSLLEDGPIPAEDWENARDSTRSPRMIAILERKRPLSIPHSFGSKIQTVWCQFLCWIANRWEGWWSYFQRFADRKGTSHRVAQR